MKCEWCGKDFLTGAWKIKNGFSKFCSIECRRDWYAKVWSQDEDWKQNRREFAVNQLENKEIGIVSKPQIIINDILSDLGINFINEKSYKSITVDNYLIDFNLIIEVMGTYWHCDNRKYKEINYPNQVRRIKMDKTKHTFIKSSENIEILYIWEKDINSDIDLCKNLILKYINNNGDLENYHSINYSYTNNIVYLNEEIIIPYMDWNIVELNKIVDIKTKERMSGKQLNKWITFNCEVCGKEKEELISHYNKKKHHCCSRKCASIFRRGKNRHFYHSNNE